MTSAYVDTEKLRGFARQLKGFADSVDSSFRALKGELARLEGTWRDQEFEKFNRQFADANRLLSKFVDEANKTAPMIERDAQRAEEIHRQSIPES